MSQVKYKAEMDYTTNNSVYNKNRKHYLENICEIRCARCPYHGGENHSRKSIQRSWKKYRKTQYKGVK